MSRAAPPETWGNSTVQTACPLDCPDSCTLDITVEKGRVVKIDGGHANPTTRGFICGKVRRFGERVYGDDRLLYPAVRKGAKGQGTFTRVTWDEALDFIAKRMLAIRESVGAEGILPFCYGGSNGLLTQDTNDAQLFRAFGTSRLARTVCAAPTGAANKALYGKMPGVTYEDYVHARLIVLWGVNPAASGIHLVPFIKEARDRGAQLVVIDPRTTSLARQADLHIAPRPGTDLPLALAIHKYFFDRGLAATAFLDEHASGVDGLRARADEWTIERAARACVVDPEQVEQFAALYASSSPALIRCGWGLERNRNGGSAAAAVMALPAVAGKFGVRGGGFSMSNSSAWGIKSAAWMDDTPEPQTRLVNMNHLGRALLDYNDPPVQMLFVYNCNPLATMPDQNRVHAGAAARGPVHGRLRAGVHRHDAVRRRRAAGDDVPGELRHRQGLRPDQPAAGPAGDRAARAKRGPTRRCSRILPSGWASARPRRRRRPLLRIVEPTCPEDVGQTLMQDGVAAPPFDGAPVQFVDVFPLTPDRKVDLYPGRARDAHRAIGSTGISRIPRPTQYPLALISPASEKTISSTLGELARARGSAADASLRCERRGASSQDDPVRVFNALGEVHVPVALNTDIKPGTVSPAEGPVAPQHLQRLDLERPGSGLPDRSRRRRVLQRRPRPGRAARQALTAGWKLPAALELLQDGAERHRRSSSADAVSSRWELEPAQREAGAD